MENATSQRKLQFSLHDVGKTIKMIDNKTKAKIGDPQQKTITSNTTQILTHNKLKTNDHPHSQNHSYEGQIQQPANHKAQLLPQNWRGKMLEDSTPQS